MSNVKRYLTLINNYLKIHENKNKLKSYLFSFTQNKLSTNSRKLEKNGFKICNLLSYCFRKLNLVVKLCLSTC